MKVWAIACIMAWVSQSMLLAKDYLVTDYGAKGDGITLNTAAIQAALDQAHADGGGRVIVPKGRFLTGSIVLKNGVELHLAKNATLLGSTNVKDYTHLHQETWLGNMALILAFEAENIALTGQGTVDGQGARLALRIDSLYYVGEIDSIQYEHKEKRPKWFLRPVIIQFMTCKNIRVTGVTIANSACWVQTYALCENLVIDKIRVESDAYWNNDGIDILDCRNVRITNCDINAADDGICLKSYRSGKPYHYQHPTLHYCDSIYIADCRVRSSASAVKLGSGSFGGFKHVTIKNIKVYDTFRSAIAIEMVHGGVLEDVLVEHVRATNTGNALFIRLGAQVFEPGILRNIVIRDMKVQVPFGGMDDDYELRGPALPFFHNVFPSSITGLPDFPVENVTLENIQITYPGRGNPAYAHMPLSRIDKIPEQKTLYPEFSMFGELPAWGLYVRHVKGLTLKNVRVKIKKPDYRPALVMDDVQGLDIEGLEVIGDDKPMDPVYLHDVEQVQAKE